MRLRATRRHCLQAAFANDYTHREVVFKNEVKTRPLASLHSRRTIIVQRRDAKGRVPTSTSRLSHFISRRE